MDDVPISWTVSLSMSIYYYPHLLTGDFSNVRNLETLNYDELEKAIDFEYSFSFDVESISDQYIVDNDIYGNLPQVLSDSLEEELIDIEDESQQLVLEEYSMLLKKIGSRDGELLFYPDFEPYVGYLNAEEVAKLRDFLTDYSFEREEVEKLKDDFISVLDEVVDHETGLIYRYA